MTWLPHDTHPFDPRYAPEAYALTFCDQKYIVCNVYDDWWSTNTQEAGFYRTLGWFKTLEDAQAEPNERYRLIHPMSVGISLKQVKGDRYDVHWPWHSRLLRMLARANPHLYDQYPAPMVHRAVLRIALGDVGGTQWGVSVAVRYGLGDHREMGNYYYPENNSGCLCRSKKSRGQCSHEIACEIVREDPDILRVTCEGQRELRASA